MSSTKTRFDSKTTPTPSGCIEWTGARTDRGYGTFHMDGRSVGAHRVALMFAGVTIPEGLEIDHLCRNRACVNPEHLEPVTRRENIRRGQGISAPTVRSFDASGTCAKGHDLTTPGSWSTGADGHRECKACRAAHARDYRRSASLEQAERERERRNRRARTRAETDPAWVESERERKRESYRLRYRTDPEFRTEQQRRARDAYRARHLRVIPLTSAVLTLGATA